MLTIKKVILTGKEQLGVFASVAINKNVIVEECPYISFNKDEYKDDKVLKNYLFNGFYKSDVVLALGYGSLYNHSKNPNLEYTVSKDTIKFTSVRNIRKSEQLFIDYGFGHSVNKLITEWEE